MLRSNLKSRYLLRSSRLTFVSTFNFYLSSYRYICNRCIVPLQGLFIIATYYVPFLYCLVTWGSKEHSDVVQLGLIISFSRLFISLIWTYNILNRFLWEISIERLKIPPLWPENVFKYVPDLIAHNFAVQSEEPVTK